MDFQAPEFSVIIPARVASSRLPGKMLADVAGTPLIIRTIRQACQSQAQQVIVATDDDKIAKVVHEAGYNAVLTSKDHPSGTDRLAEVVQKLSFPDHQIVVNVQGDEPLIEPKLINQAAQSLSEHPQAAMATCAYPITDINRFFNPNIVKVVCDAQQYALTFSRAPIPWHRQAFSQAVKELPSNFPALHHVGLYAYRAAFLKKYPTLAVSPLEQIEQLEQLRALEQGYKIYVFLTQQAPLPGVDTQEDLDNLRQFLAQNS